jgi:hypothetical protein
MKKIVILFVIVTCLTVLFFFLIKKGGSNNRVIVLPTPAPTSYPSPYHGLVPGVSTEQNVIDSLGSPLKKDVGANSSTLVFSSKINSLPVSVDVAKTGVVYRINEPVGLATRYQDVTKDLGKPNLVLYGPLQRAGFSLFVFLDKGVAFLANLQTQEVKERLYFQPTSQELFLQTVAPGMSLKSSVGQQ